MAYLALLGKKLKGRWFESIWLVTLASVPVSLRWTEMPGEAVVAVPLEILVAVCGLILGIWLFRGARPDRRLLFHPISLAILERMPVNTMTKVKIFLGEEITINRITAEIRLLCSAIPIPSMATRTIPRGAKLVKFVTTSSIIL